MTINQNQRQYAVGILTNRLAVQRAIQALEKADFPLGAVLLKRRYPDKQNQKIESGESEQRWRTIVIKIEDTLGKHKNSLKK